jgi:hypothetical protein
MIIHLMIKPVFIGLIIIWLPVRQAAGQDSTMTAPAPLEFKGQLSAYTHVNPRNDLPWWSGIRYIPQLNYRYGFQKERLFDVEASANLYGNLGIHPFDTVGYNGDLKPYRIWARYSSRQFELRLGLQKINFGSASILRPLMWFDRIDPRDPLQLTDGVWGVLARYYFLNNANFWFWGLYGNKNLKGWETFPTSKKRPEFGGRFQFPLPYGEAGMSYHHRLADARLLNEGSSELEYVPENRFGIDAKFDMVVGWWLEGSWSRYGEELGMYSNQEILNLGIDYTFGVGNGLTLILEQLFASYDEKAFAFDEPLTFSLLNIAYPIGIFDQLNAIIYYDWTHQKIYNFLNWQKQFNRFTFYLMGYINPKEYYIPTQGSEEMLYAGSGIQVMLVFNH